ncbi:hypothetical protein KVR01_007622 [Diaporthe batatas]|uniref:uncharacterized protein n=1 Tax=Diaporthe batatas TaxID=748121 RepID=UPI001D052201|nr:uncharacterized protein KVR01_007622 [Diaporthe batatas]KAG8163144.1 hypothetical protein KVR01_007622 [Diaporthe batatas]
MADGQKPLAVVGLACRLPGGNSSPAKLWDFLEEGKVASNEVPPSRFNFAGHWDGSHKPGTMRPKGGMFLSEQDVDLAAFDASFFEVAGTEAIATDPNQRQMLEIVYEGLESAGLPMEKVNGTSTACFVSSFAERPNMTDLGVGRAILANRISWFFNLKGPSVTIDTACSGSLVALDMACRTLRSGEVDTAIVATSNLYLSPEHVIDSGFVGEAHSPTGLCHTFDAAADGYVKAEAVSCLIVKRLETALRDRDPIRAVIRGVAVNSNGRTNGIGSPSSDAQAAAIRKAYANAGISDLNDTQYLECHGTGTQRGDAEEVAGIGDTFAPTRDTVKPLLIGSIKANVGHAEPAAGLSGLIKTILSLEHGMIPGSPLFVNPNPRIDFSGSKVRPFRHMLPWPDTNGKPKRASVNSFGYGDATKQGEPPHVASIRPVDEVTQWVPAEANCHARSASTSVKRPYTLVVSANDAVSLKDNIAALCTHLANPRVRLSLRDLAYTLAQRRSHLWHRAFVSVRSNDGDGSGSSEEFECRVADFSTAKKPPRPPRVGFVFTGQGAQWPQMGRDLLRVFPATTRAVLQELDDVLQGMTACKPPRWSLLEKLTEPFDADSIRQPEFSQPLVTALQLCLLAVLEKWGIAPCSVVGHSSGEIAAAHAAGLLSRADAIKAAFFRGRAIVAASEKGDMPKLGMLAVGLGRNAVTPFLEAQGGHTSIACFNSPDSVTISGPVDDLEVLEKDIKGAGHFARILKVDMAYHSPYMDLISSQYEDLLTRDGFHARNRNNSRCPDVSMFSSVTASMIGSKTPPDIQYWKLNLLSPVRFDEAVQEMLSQPDNKSPDILVEIGPSGALAGPISQICKLLSSDVSYHPAWSRGAEPIKTLFDVAGWLFITGVPVDLSAVNASDSEVEEDTRAPRCIVDLPGYRWNHSAKYWYESAASKDWRFRRFVTHDLLGSKILGTPWTSPCWHKRLELNDVPWLRHHKMDGDVLMPATAFCAMALEAMYQKHSTLELDESLTQKQQLNLGVNDFGYGLRNVRFTRALVLEESGPTDIYVTLTRLPRSSEDSGWHEFRISTSRGNVNVDHCNGLIRVQDTIEERLAEDDERRQPLRFPQTFSKWYKTQREVGMDFGTSFQKVKQLEAVSGERSCRALVDLTPSPSKWNPQSKYTLHPATWDACLHTLMAPNACNERSLVRESQVPGIADECFINPIPRGLSQGLVLSRSDYSGRGRLDQAKGLLGNVSVYDAESGKALMGLKNLHYATLDAPPKPDLHVFDATDLKPGGLQAVIDLIAHKKPQLKVLELIVDDTSDDNVSSVWLVESVTAARDGCIQYNLACSNADKLVTLKRKHQDAGRSANYYLANLNDQQLGLATTTPPGYDLIILRVPKDHEGFKLQIVLERLELLSSEDGLALVVPAGTAVEIGTWPSTSSVTSSSSELAKDPNVSSNKSSELNSETTKTSLSHSRQPANPNIIPPGNRSDVSKPCIVPSDIKNFHHLLTIEDELGIHYLIKMHGRRNGGTASMKSTAHMSDKSQHLNVIIPQLPSPSQCPEAQEQLLSQVSSTFEDIAQSLGASQKKLTCTLIPVSDANATTSRPAPNTIVMVLDELFTSVLAAPSPTQWSALQALLASGCSVLWLTAGAASEHPERAMAHGLLRVVRREFSIQDQASRVILDVDPKHISSCNEPSLALARAISKVLWLMQGGRHLVEPEYRLEKNGILSIPRLVPDTPVKEFRSMGGSPTAAMAGLWGTKGTVRLRGDRVGTLNLTWCECEEEPLLENYVEVQVEAVGVNFKDVACLMGIIPEDEHMIGCECAGVVRRLGPGVSKFRTGDRVVVQGQGNYANRVQSIAHCVQVIPSWMSFEDAATIPLVYTTALKSLFHLGNLQEHQTVLIHSAAGGVGLAAIQLAQYKKADIFVTVDSSFARGIMAMTQGRGIDVVLNSLTGDLLDASWRIVADGGTMIEIGKRDIYERNALSMEPFSRNCSFRALDLSFGKTLKMAEMTGELLKEVFELIEAGHVGPIRPVTTYGFEDVPAALSFMRSGQHVGKIVVAKGAEDVQVPIKTLPRNLNLRQDVSYLIVGGLKGLCGSLAVHMARHGARHIIVCSRSGIDDEMSQRIVRDCRSYMCEVSGQKGDVCEVAFVRRVFESAHPRPIMGIIQGAMVLKDKPFEDIKIEDYQLAIAAKVTGTWNLHQASLEDSSLSSQPLEFFTLLSSISGVVGNKGQATYAAANAFLDAFSAYRRSLGLPAHSLDLGAIDDVGYIAEQEAIALANGTGPNGSSAPLLADRFRRDNQWTPLNEQTLRSTLTISILQQQARPLSDSPQLVTGIAHPLTGDELLEDARFSYLYGGAGTRMDGNAQNFGKGGTLDAPSAAVQAFSLLKASGILAAGTKALEKAALTALAAQTVKVLRVETEVEVGKPLASYGLDSLSAVELRGFIRSRLGAELSTLDITRAGSLVELAEKVVSKLNGTK